jgi:hypothetical protein
LRHMSSAWKNRKLKFKTMQTKKQSTLRAHKIEMLTPTCEDYKYVMTEVYDGSEEVANYFRYMEDDSDDLFFLQQKDGQFYLILNNMDWLTSDLEKIVRAMQWYNEPFEETPKKRELSLAEINLMKGELYNAIEDAIQPIWASQQTKFGVGGDTDIPLQCRYDEAMNEVIACIVQQISDELKLNNAN